MSDAVLSIRNAAMSLSEDERLELADALYDSVEWESDQSFDEELLAELDRRRQELKDDPSKGISWQELKAHTQS